MMRKQYLDEEDLKILREIELTLTARGDVTLACRSVGISDGTYHNKRKRFRRMGRQRLSKTKSLKKENVWLKKIVVELELD